MKIGIDARMYKRGLGIGRYIQKLLEHLEALDDAIEYVVFLLPENFHEYQPCKQTIKKICVNAPWYSLKEQLVMPLVLLRARCDLVHFPHFNVPLLYPKKFLVTIHDLILIKHPLSATSAASTRSPWVHRMKYAAYRYIVGAACRRASAIITVSRFVKKDVVIFFSLPEHKVRVALEGSDPFESCNSEFVPAEQNKPYLFCAGNSYPHKNLEGLLSAWNIVSAKYPKWHLILCGQEDYFTKKIRRTIKDYGMEDSVVHLGPVSDQDLCGLYCNAGAYVFPSFEEGFGLPGLEAMREGLPVAASNSSCLPEIYGDAALYFDPENISECALAIQRVMSDEGLRMRLRAAGFEQIKKYSWRTMATTIREVYNETIEE